MFACQLTQKAYQQGHRITIDLDNEAAANELDQLLWSFRAESFVAHEKLADANRIEVGALKKPQEVLLNLTMNAVDDNSWQRLLQIVPADDALKAQARELFKVYKERGFVVNTRKI